MTILKKLLKTSIIIFFTGLFFIEPTIAQDHHKIDSLLGSIRITSNDTSKIKLLLEIGKIYENSLPDSALYYYDIALSASIKANRKKDIARCLSFKGIVYSDQGDYSNAMIYYLKSLKIFEIAGDSEDVANCYISIGMANSDQGIYDKALEYYSKSLKIFEKLEDKSGTSACYINIGNVYLRMGAYYKAIAYFFKSLKIKEELREKKGIAICYIDIGNVYFMLSDYDKAKEYFWKSLNIEKVFGNKYKMANCYNSIGSVCVKQGTYDKAIEYYMKSLKINKKISNKNGMSNCYDNIGTVYLIQHVYYKTMEYYFKSLKIKKEIGNKNGLSLTFANIAILNIKLKKYNEAIEYANKGLYIAKEIGGLLVQRGIYESLSIAYDSLHNIKKAYEYYKLFKNINDSIFNEKSSKQIANLQIQYETEKKKKEIEIQALKISKQNLLLEKNRMWTTIFIICFLLIIAFGLITFLRYRIKQQARLKTEKLRQQEMRTNAIITTQEDERKRIAQDLHDGIGQLLSGIKINLSALHSEMIGLPDENNKSFEKILNMIDNACSETRSISHQMMPKSLANDDVVTAIYELLNYTCNDSKITFSFVPHNIEKIPKNIEIQLYHIVQELINNIIKHSDATKASVQLMQNAMDIVLIVEDDGVGFNTSNNEKGIGLLNITTRVNLLNGQFSIAPAPFKGTLVIIRIPIKQ